MLTDELLQPLAFGIWREASGGIARKGDTLLMTDPGRPMIGVVSPKPVDLVREFGDLERVLRDKLCFDSASRALYYEVGAQAITWASRPALASLRMLNTDSSLAGELADILDLGPAWSVGVHLVQAEGDVLSPDWWHLELTPSFRSPNNTYRLTFVCRKPDRSRILSLADNIDGVFVRVIERVEREHE